MSGLVIPEPLDIRFEGFSPEAFEVLNRLRNEPHIEQYRKEKDAFQQHVMRPFRKLRDDLAVNWVLPNRLNLETERNVFSRILKNDFGAGGCHHHVWLSFYRPGRRRLTDVQLAQAIYPDRFSVSLYVGGYARGLLRAARMRMGHREAEFLGMANPLLESGYVFRIRTSTDTVTAASQLQHLPGELARATDMWLRTSIPSGEVIDLRSRLVGAVLSCVQQLWPIFEFWTDEEDIRLNE